MARTTRRPPGLYKPPPQPFGPLTRALAARSPLCAAAETLAAPSPLTFAVAASPPTWSRLGVTQGGEEITRAACGHPRAPSHPGKLAGVASPPHRAARRRHRKRAVRAALDDSAALRSTFRCKSRMKSSPLARICGTPVRPPPTAAIRRRPHARVRLQPPDQDLTVLIKVRRRLRSSCHRPLDLDPKGWIRSNPSQYRSNRHDSVFLQKTP
jgi:hypothetical protein